MRSNRNDAQSIAKDSPVAELRGARGSAATAQHGSGEVMEKAVTGQTPLTLGPAGPGLGACGEEAELW